MQLDTFSAAIWPTLPITAKTRSNYESAYRVNVQPRLGSLELDQISKNDLVEVLSLLRPQTRYVTLMMLRVLYREGLERELVSANVAATIKSPRIQVKQQKFLTWEELNAIDFGGQNSRIRFLALHGLRYGEAAALTPNDVRDGYVYVTKSIHGATKSVAGVRKVPLLAEFTPFPAYQKQIAKALKPYGVTVHSLRKTYAYTLKSANVHVTTAAKLMGHSNPLVTLKIYTQVLDNEVDVAADAIRAFMENIATRQIIDSYPEKSI